MPQHTMVSLQSLKLPADLSHPDCCRGQSRAHSDLLNSAMAKIGVSCQAQEAQGQETPGFLIHLRTTKNRACERRTPVGEVPITSLGNPSQPALPQGQRRSEAAAEPRW